MAMFCSKLWKLSEGRNAKSADVKFPHNSFDESPIETPMYRVEDVPFPSLFNRCWLRQNPCSLLMVESYDYIPNIDTIRTIGPSVNVPMIFACVAFPLSQMHTTDHGLVEDLHIFGTIQ